MGWVPANCSALRAHTVWTGGSLTDSARCASMVRDKDALKRTAIHESGHVLVVSLTPVPAHTQEVSAVADPQCAHPDPWCATRTP